MSIRELKKEEVTLVTGGNKQIGTITEFPPPQEPEIPPLPGLIPLPPTI